MISKCDIIYIFTRVYSKTLTFDFKSKILFGDLSSIAKIKILNELGNFIFCQFINLINHTENITFLYNSCKYMNDKYVQYYNDNREIMNVEILARKYSLNAFSKKFDFPIVSFKYDPSFLSLLLLLKTKIDLYIYSRFPRKEVCLDSFHLYCRSELASKYCKLLNSNPLFKVDCINLSSQVGLVQDLLTFY